MQPEYNALFGKPFAGRRITAIELSTWRGQGPFPTAERSLLALRDAAQSARCIRLTSAEHEEWPRAYLIKT
jgi:hypothetical protein